MHGEQGALLCTARIVETVPWVDAKYYADEGHGFFKRENQIDSLERTVAWFDRYMGSDSGVQR